MGDKPAKNSNDGKDEVRIEGRLSKEHTHNNGTRGCDIYAAKVIYHNGKKVYEKNAHWGHAHYNEEDDDSGDDNSEDA